jgi:type I restriction enzyme R subunit
MLEHLPPSYDDLFDEKCAAVYQHVYDLYYGPEQSVYGVVA